MVDGEAVGSETGSSGVRTIDAKQLAVKRPDIRYGFMDALSQSLVVQILRTHNYAGVLPRCRVVKGDEISPVKGQHSATLFRRETQDIHVRDALSRFSGLVRRENVMAQLPERLNRTFWEVLVRVEARHQASSFARISASISA
jgi:hypothetical protein